MGIVVAELVTNSYDHAFNGGRGAIRVSVHHDLENACGAIMTVGDNGQGFETVPGSKRQGIGLVQRLVQQVSGTAVLTSDHGGTLWTIRFPLDDLPLADLPLAEPVPAVA
jgi:two-component sensor histidine kinase